MLTCCGALGKDKIKVCKAFTVYVNLSAASDNALRIKAICAAHLCKSYFEEMDPDKNEQARNI